MSEPNGDLLQIYDASARTWLWNNPLFERNDDASVSLGVNGTKELHEELAKLLAAGRTFARVAFQTHGESGMLWLGNEKRSLVAYFDFTGDQAWRDAGYHKLFPSNTKMIFGGCNVAEGDNGWKFLENAGKLLLRSGGGYTLGWTSLGFHILGHDMHFWGDWRRVNFLPGGFAVGRGTKSDVVPDINRPWDNRWR